MFSKKNKVVFYEVFEEERCALDGAMSPQIDAVYVQETIQEAGHKEAPAQVISVRTQSRLPLEWAKGLDGILTRSAGFDHLAAYQAAVRKEIPCAYLPSYCARAVAEHAILMLLALWRKLPQEMAQVQGFCRDGLTGEECLGKRLVVVGVGRIGTEILKMAKALGMQVRGVDIDPRERDAEYVSFEGGTEWADAVVSAVPLTQETRGLFSAKVFERMKPSVIFVNVSRGEVSPLEDLKNAFEKGRIAGAALDVYEDEGLLGAELRGAGEKMSSSVEIFRRLLAKPNVILTPHNAFNTKEAVQRKARQSVESLELFFNTGRFVDQVPGGADK